MQSEYIWFEILNVNNRLVDYNCKIAIMVTINEFNTDIVFHPGETLAEKLEELKMGPKELSIRIGK